MLSKLIDKAATLIEAMPYLRQFRGETIVVKFGGSAMENQDKKDSILTDISFMSCVGMHPVIVHGGGKAITRALKKEGIEPRFIDGLRVSDKATVQVVQKVLTDEISAEIVTAIEKKGIKANRIPGADIIRSIKHTDEKNGKAVDLGFVGDVVSVDPRPILDAISRGMVPVISPVGADAEGNIYNNNADVAAAEVAISVEARKLVFLSDVHGIMRTPGDDSSFLGSLHSSEVDGLIKEGVISGGMLPKVKSGIKAIQAGVKKTHIIDGNLKHSLLLELFTESGIGTEITV